MHCNYRAPAEFPNKTNAFVIFTPVDLQYQLTNVTHVLNSKSVDTMEVVDKSPEEEGSEEDFASQEHSVIVEFLQAAWYAVLSHTEFICYFLVFLYQVI